MLSKLVTSLVSRATFAPFVREIDGLLMAQAAALSAIAEQSHGGAQLKMLRAKLAQEKLDNARIERETTGADTCPVWQGIPHGVTCTFFSLKVNTSSFCFLSTKHTSRS